ncbi:MAG TPA: hypothetical protein VEU07_04030, partial [Candidatus Acidoferrum sp.]|nr:hypothetical protein [Candidatus Acidoferrum sp.]
MFLWALLILPPLLAGACLLARTPRQILRLVSAGGAGWACLAGAMAWTVFAHGPIFAARGWLYLDALSAYHAVVLGLVFGASSLYAWGYFSGELAAGTL